MRGHCDRRKWSLRLLLLIGVVALALVPLPVSSAGPEGVDPLAEKPRSFTIVATGDLLIHDRVADSARTADGWDFTPMFRRVAGLLRSADLAVCHLETPLSADNTDLSYYPLFRVPNQLADAIAHAGYDTCSLASNHSVDGGRRSVVATIEGLDRVGVAHTGMARSSEERETLNLLKVRGATVAHLSYTYGLNTGELPPDQTYLANIIDPETILAEARRAKDAGADFVIVSMHWGIEYTSVPSPYQTTHAAHLLLSPDIDLILGHHAHVVQPVAEIGGKYVAYGLGNFVSNQAQSRCAACPIGVEEGVILHLRVTEDVAADRWLVSAVSHTPTWVDRATFTIVDVAGAAGRYHPAVLGRSSARTAAALEAQGIAVPVAPRPVANVPADIEFGRSVAVAPRWVENIPADMELGRALVAPKPVVW